VGARQAAKFIALLDANVTVNCFANRAVEVTVKYNANANANQQPKCFSTHRLIIHARLFALHGIKLEHA
jgi:hypothetical protein